MYPPSIAEWQGGPIKSYEKNLFLTFWHQMDHWYRDIGLFRGERKRRESEWLSALSGGSRVPCHTWCQTQICDRPSHSSSIRLIHSHIFISNMFYILFDFDTKVQLTFRIKFYLSLIGRVKSWCPLIGCGEERVVIDRDQFLRTRSVVTGSGRHQTASPASHLTSETQPPVTRVCQHCSGARDTGAGVLIVLAIVPLITGAAWQAGAHTRLTELLSQNESKYDQWMYDTDFSLIFSFYPNSPIHSTCYSSP